MRPPDALVCFTLTAGQMDGLSKSITSGYRPVYDIRSDYWTSTHHEFPENDIVTTGDTVIAKVWFITPDVYPHTLWEGRVFNVAEGSRVIGQATVLKVNNPILARG